MNKIEIFHTSIVINDYKFGDSVELEKFFRIWEPNTHSYKYFGLHYDKEESKLYLPRGIDIWFVEKCLDCKAHMNYKPDPYSYIEKDIMISKLPRDDNQKEALRFLLGKGEYTATSTKSQLFVNLATGKGKSYCSITACSYLNMRFAVITYSTDCLNQWAGYIQEYTNINPKRICMVKGAGTINRLMQLGTDKYDIFLLSHDTIKSYASQFGWSAISKLFKILNIGIKIIDEVHKNFTNTCMIDFYTNTMKTFYVTATKGRSSQEENQIFQLYFKNILSIDLFDPNVDPHTSYKALMFNSNPSARTISACKNAYGLNRIAYMKYIVENDNFYKMLSIVLDMSISHNAKTLIYIGINEGVMKVYEWITSTFPMLQNNVGIYTTLTSKDQKQNELQKLIILSTMKSCAEAMDIKGLKITVVAAEPFKSDILAIQSLGRTRDRNTLYLEFVDTGFYYTKYYYNCKKPVFKKYALDCSQIMYDQETLDIKYDEIYNKYRPRQMVQLINGNW